MTKRSVFFLSDGTGLTAEMLGQSLLSQFSDVSFDNTTIPYIDTLEKAQQVKQTIDACYTNKQTEPLVFATFVDIDIRNIIADAKCLFFDFLASFIKPLEQSLAVKSTHHKNQSHAMHSYDRYKARIDAVDFSLKTDDGCSPNYYDKSEIILVGVSRSGKTPTSLYLSLQFGIHVSNYPLTEEDISQSSLPNVLRPHRKKLFGLTISPKRLIAIRQERSPNSRYASLSQCEKEIKAALRFFQEEDIPYLDSTDLSIEELSTRILETVGISRRGRY